MSIARPQFESLVRSEHAAVYRTAARLLPPADAEDVTQQVFTRVWEGKTPLGEVPAVTLRWLAGRLALNTLRGARNRRQAETERAMHDEQLTSDPDFKADEREAVRIALAALPHDLRTAVALRYQADLTFDEVAQALACSLSTAHDRVRRGLDRLQQALARGRFALLGARLPEVLSRLQPAGPVPPGLETQLLAVPEAAAAMTIGAGAWSIAALAIVGAGVGLALVFGRGGSALDATPATSAVAAVAEGEQPATQDPPPVRRPIEPPGNPGAGNPGAGNPASPSPVPAPPGAPAATREAPANEPTARVFGNVFDASDGRALALAKVAASSLARGSKGQSFSRSTTADAQGHFTLALPIAGEREAYTVWVQVDDYEQLTQTHTLAAGAAVELRAPLQRWAKDVPGAWQMEVSVRDELGTPVARAVVTVHRRQTSSAARQENPEEVNGVTDASGRVTLRGTHHGEKLIRIAAPPAEKPPTGPVAGPVAGTPRLATASRQLALRDAGPHSLSVTLPAGQIVAGVVRAAATGKPVAGFSLRAVQDAEDVGWGFTDAEGRFRIEGLGREPLTLRGHQARWSSFTASGLQAGDEHIELLVKANSDPQPRGLFGGELHGRVLDAATGAPIVVSAWAVEGTWWPAEGASGALLEELLNPAPSQRAMEGPLPDPSSEFHVTNLGAGRYGLVARHPGYAPCLLGPFEVGPGRLVNGLELKLARGGTVSGVVSDGAGRPVGGAVVYATASADAAIDARKLAQALAGGDLYPGYRYTKCDAKGSFRLEHVPADLTLRVVAADGRAGATASEAFTLRNDAAQTLTLRLQN